MAKSKSKDKTSARYDANPSLRLEEFLNALREMKSKYGEARADIDEADMETQDILHAIEFRTASVRSRSLESLIRKTRTKRRAAKVYREIVGPLVTWAEDNKKTIGELQAILGNMRKAEDRAASRVYTPRTSILGE